MATADFIGALISLVSKSDIRYQGVLTSINPEQATIALENVRSWGTEDRIGKPQEEIPPSDQVYGFIMFRAADVKDLKIDDPNPQKPNRAALNDPAILNSSAAPGPNNFGPPMSGPGMLGAPPRSQAKHKSFAPTSSADQVLEEMSKLSVSNKPSHNLPASLPAIPHAAAAAARRPVRQHIAGPISVPTNDYDFESANAKFSKPAPEARLDSILPPLDSFYDKSGFFDNISSEIKERYDPTPPSSGDEFNRARGKGRGRANRMAEERKNLQTFGDTGSSGNYRGGGRGRRKGRGRGGYVMIG